jgi:large subunit ribosomal protein L9
MKVILLENIKSKGFKGDVIEVSDGYAQNFLFPQNKAVEATQESLDRLMAQEKKAEKEVKRTDKMTKDSAQALDGAEIVIVAKTNEDGTLYGSISRKDIVKAAKESSIQLKVSNLKSYTPLKEVGEHAVTAEFSGGYEANFRVIVEGKK